jgi:hypothetical protein
MAAMKTDLLLLAGVALALLAVPMVSHAEDDDWATRSPLAAGEPMEDCDIHHTEAVIAAEPAPLPAVAAEKADATPLATPDVVPVLAPVATPAVAAPVAAPVKAPPDKTTQAAPRSLSPATLLTFALIASPGTALPQTGTMSGTRD